MSTFLPSALLLVSTLCTAQTTPTPITPQPYGNLTTISNVSTAACPPPGGCHIIVARGSLEPPGYGSIGALKDALLGRIPGSTAEAVSYPAQIKPSYVTSETDGVVAMKRLIGDFVASCDAKIPLVLLGFSQGAQVVSDTLVGQDDADFPRNGSTALPPSTLSRVAAAIMMGDPSSNLTGQTFHVGNATTNGKFPRRNNAVFDTVRLTGRLRSYCDEGDPFCASGKDLQVHLGTINRYEDVAVGFVVGRVEGFYRNASSGEGNSTTMAPEVYTGTARRMWEVEFILAVVVGLVVVVLMQ